MRSLKLAVALFVGLTATVPASAETVNAIADDYVALMVNAQALKPDLVVVAKPDLARVEKLELPAIRARAGALQARLEAIKAANPLEAMRARSMRARLVSLIAQLDVAGGARLDMTERVERYYGFKPEFPHLEDYDEALGRLDKAMPGAGTLAERIDALKTAARVPADKVEPVFRAAMAECRRRTVANMALPPESTEVQFVHDKLVPAENNYLGNGKSITRISLDVPGDVDRMLVMACHEVYPGHHMHFTNLDDAVGPDKGFREGLVELADTPVFPVAEAIAEYGVGLAFPVEDRIAFQRDILYPLAGLTMRDEGAWRALISARPDVLGASATVARDYMAGSVDSATTERRLIRYRLQTPTAAKQTIKMIDAFGSAVIASDFGWFTMDRTMRGKPIAEQWRLLREIQRQPMLLDDIRALATK